MFVGLDRLMAILCGNVSLQDVIAFPKSTNGRDLLIKAPTAIDSKELATYGIQLTES